MRIIRLGLIIIVIILSGCTVQTGSELFLAPDIITTEVTVEEDQVILECFLSDPRVDYCGFAYSEIGQNSFEKTISSIKNDSFEVKLKHLKPGTSYEWYAYICSRGSEIRSESKFFTVEDKTDKGIVNITDRNFKEYLVENFDTDGDGEISYQEAESVSKIEIKTGRVYSLEGISAFRYLDSLVCTNFEPYRADYSGYQSYGKLNHLDLSNNRYLSYLQCNGNMLETLVLPESNSLRYLDCSYNYLKEIDITRVPSLVYLAVENTKITSLELSACLSLETLNCSMTPIEELDISKNFNLTYLDNIDEENGKKTSTLKRLYISENQEIEGITENRSDDRIHPDTEIIEIISFKDEEFGKYCLNEFDTNKDGVFSVAEAASVKEINITTENISSLDGLEYFVNLESLRCVGGIVEEVTNDYGDHIFIHQGMLIELDISKNTKLKYLKCASNKLTSIDLSNNPELLECIIDDNKLSSLDLSNNKKIEYLSIFNNPLITISDIRNLPLKELKLSQINLAKQMSEDYLTNFPELIWINISGFEGTNIDFSKNSKLESIECWDMPNIEILDLSNLPNLKRLNCGSYDRANQNNMKLKKVIVHKDIDIDKLIVRKNDDTRIVNSND